MEGSAHTGRLTAKARVVTIHRKHWWAAVAAAACLACGAVSLSPAPAFATITSVTLYVNGAFAGTTTPGCAVQAAPCTTIAQAITPAEAHTYADVTIDVAAGTYTQALSITVPATDTLTIHGAGAATTTIDDGASGTNITVGSGFLTVSDLTISGGSATNGGGVSAGDDAALVFDDDIFTSNAATASGGAIYTSGNATVTLNTDQLTDNTAPNAGALYAMGNVVMSDTTVSGNTGGAIEDVYGVLSVIHSTISDNIDGAYYYSGIWARTALMIISSTIDGNGPEQPAVNGASTILESDSFDDNAIAAWASQSLRVEDCTFSHTASVALDEEGDISGSVYDSTFIDNGTGFESDSLSTATLTSDVFDDNGIGVYSEQNSTTISDSTFTGNSSASSGGAIYDELNPIDENPGSLTLTGNTFTSNSAVDDGGAIYVDSDYQAAGSVSMIDNTFSDNQATGDGGAVYEIEPATSTIINDTFASNTSGASGGAFFLQNNSSTPAATLSNDTFSNNSAATTGGAWDVNAPTALTIEGSIFSHNSAAVGPSCGASFSLGGYNVADDTSCPSTLHDVNDSSTIDLSPLAANGSTGPETMAISSSSSAHDEVPLADCLTMTDERGATRPGTVGSDKCDAGAYELQGAAPDTPRNVVVSLSARSVTVSWAASPTTGHEPLLDYVVSARSTTSTATCTTKALTCAIGGLDYATAYKVSVTADGFSTKSAPSPSVTVYPVPTLVFHVMTAAPVELAHSTFPVVVSGAIPGTIASVTVGTHRSTCRMDDFLQCAVSVSLSPSDDVTITAAAEVAGKAKFASARVSVATVSIPSVTRPNARFAVTVTDAVPGSVVQVLSGSTTKTTAHANVHGDATVTVLAPSTGSLSVTVKDDGVSLVQKIVKT